MWTIVPISPAFSFSAGRSSANTTESCSLIMLNFAGLGGLMLPRLGRSLRSGQREFHGSRLFDLFGSVQQFQRDEAARLVVIENQSFTHFVTFGDCAGAQI